MDLVIRTNEYQGQSSLTTRPLLGVHLEREEVTVPRVLSAEILR
jgi:hypothetical protein